MRGLEGWLCLREGSAHTKHVHTHRSTKNPGSSLPAHMATPLGFPTPNLVHMRTLGYSQLTQTLPHTHSRLEVPARTSKLEAHVTTPHSGPGSHVHSYTRPEKHPQQPHSPQKSHNHEVTYISILPCRCTRIHTHTHNHRILELQPHK